MLLSSNVRVSTVPHGNFKCNQGSAAGDVQRAEFAVPCDMRKSHALAGPNH